MFEKCLLTVSLMGLAAAVLLAQQGVRIRVDASKKQGAFRPVWTWVGQDEPNYTYSEDGRKLLTELSRLGPYPFHDRTHNLLTTGDGTPALKWGSTGVYTLDRFGRPVYNWAIMDKIFDTYQTTGVIPLVEIGFMPEALSTHPQPYQHHWPKGPLFTGWSYPPKDYMAWADLVYGWVRHMVARYGAKEVLRWEWEVWNEPNIGYWHGTLEEYCRFYDYTTNAVKRALPEARVGGPATTGPASQEAARFLQGFLNHCASGKNYVNGQTGAPLDFISFHAKGRTRFVDGHVEMDIGNNLRDIDQGFKIIARFPALRRLPIVLSESDPEGCAACSATSHPEDGYRLTPQYASYEAELLSRSLALAERDHVNMEGAVTWASTFPGQPVFAGFRALTSHEIDLPVLNLFRMLGLMGGERVATESAGDLGLDALLQSSVRTRSDVNAMATREEHAVNVLVWNYDDEDVPEPPAEINLTVGGLPRDVRRIRLEHFRVDRDHSNSYTAWQAMGSPQDPSPSQHSKLEAAGQLQLLTSPKWMRVESGKVEFTFLLPRQALSLLDLEW